jgi:hypothetical protein
LNPAAGVMPHPNKLPGSSSVNTPAGVLPVPSSNSDWQLNQNVFNNNNNRVKHISIFFLLHIFFEI